MSKPTIRILHNLARVGGTIVSRCLGCMDGVALLSEIHPTLVHPWNDPVIQAREWYGIEVSAVLPFVEKVEVLNEAFRARGLAMVLRSWDHVDFVPSQHNQTPALRSTLVDALADRFELRRVAIDRDDRLAQLGSMEQFGVPCGALAFARGCVGFAGMGIPRTTYERFLEKPGFVLEWLCSVLDLPFDRGWEAKWQAYAKVTGDIGNQAGRAAIGRP